MRIVFAGTPPAAVPSIRRLAASGHDVVAAVTRPDAPVGRHRRMTPSPVASAAEALLIPVIRTRRLDDAATAAILSHAPDVGVVVAYGGMVREPLLTAPAHGWVNLHFSLLPRWRGAAPVQRALIAGDTVTGATVFRLTADLDAGAVLGHTRYAVPPGATAGDVLDALAHRGSYLIEDVVTALASGTAHATPQVGAVTHAPKLTVDDGRLHWDEPADRVLARWAGTTPEPGAFTTVDGVRVKILAAHPADAAVRLPPGRMAAADGCVLVGTASDAVAIDAVQPAGRSGMTAADWWRGLRVDEPTAGS